MSKRNLFAFVMEFTLALVLLMSGQALAEDKPCHTTVGKRVILGREPTASALYAQLRTEELGSWDSDFWIETFAYIGESIQRWAKHSSLAI